MILQISSTGRVALTKEIMDHLGVKPGDELELELLPGRQAMIRAVSRNETAKKTVI